MTLQYDIPDLSNLPMHGGTFVLSTMFADGGPKDYRAFALAANFVRLTDLALREYELGREFIHDFVLPHQPRVPFIATNHFETSIVALKRAIDFLKALRGSPHVPLSLKRLLPRRITVLSTYAENKVTGMRDAIQHLEERVRRGQIAQGESIMLAFSLNEGNLRLGARTIRYADLASWIRSLNVIAESVAGYGERGLATDLVLEK